jgi:hypothetical protein
MGGEKEEKWEKLYEKYKKKPSEKNYWKYFVLTVIALGLISLIIYYFYFRIPSITIENFASSLTNLTSPVSYRIWLHSLGKGNCYWLTTSPSSEGWQLELWKYRNTSSCITENLAEITRYSVSYPVNIGGKSCLCYSLLKSVEIKAELQTIRAKNKVINVVIK